MAAGFAGHARQKKGKGQSKLLVSARLEVLGLAASACGPVGLLWFAIGPGDWARIGPCQWALTWAQTGLKPYKKRKN